jgi:hypothetical protein
MTNEKTAEKITALKNKAVEIQIDKATLDASLALLKGIDLSAAIVNVYVVKTTPSNKNKRFSKMCRLNCRDALKDQFRGYVTNCITPLEHVAELRDISTNQDNRAFYVEAGATDFGQAVNAIQAGNITAINSPTDLNQFNSYMIQLTYGEDQRNIYAYRYISSAWSLKNTAGSTLSLNMLSNELIAGVDTHPRFQISSNIDLVQAGDSIFVTNLKNFETAMNYHERLNEKKAEAVTALSGSNVVTTAAAQILSETIGTDKHLMRQLASVHAKGFYANDAWMTKLKTAADAVGTWLIRFDAAGNLIVDNDKDYVKELLTLLQNKRVETVVDHNVFDVDGELIPLTSGS